MKLRGRITLFLILLLTSFMFFRFFINAMKGDCILTYTSDQNFKPLFYENGQLYIREEKKYFKPFPVSKDLKQEIDPILHFHQLESPFTCQFLNILNPEKKTYTFLNKNNELIQEFYSIYNTPVWQSHAFTRLPGGNFAFLSTSSDLYFEKEHYLKLFNEHGITKEGDKYILDQSSGKKRFPGIPFVSIDIYSLNGEKESNRLVPIEEDFGTHNHKLLMFSKDDSIFVFYVEPDKITMITLDDDNSFRFNTFDNPLLTLPDSSALVDDQVILLSTGNAALKRTVISLEDGDTTFREFIFKDKVMESRPIDKNRFILLHQRKNRDYISLFDNNKKTATLGYYYSASFKNINLTEDRNTLIYQEQIDNNTFKVYRKELF